MFASLKIVLIAGVTATITYFAGIQKERHNVKWKERRDAIKELYSYLQALTVDLQYGNIPNPELGDITKKVFYNQMSVLPEDIDKKVFELSYQVTNYISNNELQTNDNLLLLMDAIGRLSLELKKKLK